jgi:hypothetical protein
MACNEDELISAALLMRGRLPLLMIEEEITLLQQEA